MWLKPKAFEGSDDPMSYNGGAHFMGLFKVGMPVPGEVKGEKASGRTMAIAAIVVIAIFVGFGLFAHFMIGHTATLPLQNDISIGMEKSYVMEIKDVVKQVKANGGELKEVSTGVFLLEDMKFKDTFFDVYLHFDSNNYLQRMEYTAEYDTGINAAARAIAGIADELQIDTLRVNDQDLSMKTNSLKQYIEFNDHITLQSYRDVTSDNSYVLRNYLHECEQAEDWAGKIDEYVVREARLYQDLDINYHTEDEMLFVRLTYGVEPDRAGLS